MQPVNQYNYNQPTTRRHGSEFTILILFILGLLFLIGALYTYAPVYVAGIVICVAAIVLVGLAELFAPRPRQVIPGQGQQVMQQRERVR